MSRGLNTTILRQNETNMHLVLKMVRTCSNAPFKKQRSKLTGFILVVNTNGHTMVTTWSPGTKKGLAAKLRP